MQTSKTERHFWRGSVHIIEYETEKFDMALVSLNAQYKREAAIHQ